MTGRPPLVSVVVPAHNAEAYIGEAVDTVLSQTLQDVELIVVDDGSSDETAARLEAYGDSLRCIRQRNGGVSRARNRGIEESRGRFVAFLDADDVWRPEKLERQTKALETRSDSRACYTAATVGDATLRPTAIDPGPADPPTPETFVLRGNVVPGGGSSMLCERELLVEAGGFDPDLSLCADWDMWLRLAAQTRLTFVDQPLVVYRCTPGSMSRNPGVLERDTLALLGKAFAGRDVPAATKSRAYGHHYAVFAGSYLHAGRYRQAARCLLRALRHDPHQLLYAAAWPSRAARRGLRSPRQ